LYDNDIVFSKITSDFIAVRYYYENLSPNDLTTPIAPASGKTSVEFYIVDITGVSGGIVSNDIYHGGKGDLSSFANKIEVVIKSAINERTNVQEHRSCFKNYRYASPDDFIINSIYDQSGNSVDIEVGIRPFMYLFSGSSVENIGALNDLGLIDVKEMTETMPEIDHTIITFKNNFPVFEQELSGYYRAKFRKHGLNQTISKNLSYKKSSSNILIGASLIIQSGDKIWSSGIIANTDRKIVIKSKLASMIKKAEIISVCLFEPLKACFYDLYSNTNNVFRLEKSHIGDDGVLYMKKIHYGTNSGKLKDFDVSLEDVNGFHIIKKSVNI
jgi:hypothetical protein